MGEIIDIMVKTNFSGLEQKCPSKTASSGPF